MKSSEKMKSLMQAVLAMVGMLLSTDGFGQDITVNIDGLNGEVDQKSPAILNPRQSLEIKVIRADFVHYDYSIELDAGVVLQPSYPITGLEVGILQDSGGKLLSLKSEDKVIRFTELKAVTAADLDQLADDYNKLAVETILKQINDAQLKFDKLNHDPWAKGTKWPDLYTTCTNYLTELDSWKGTLRNMKNVRSSIDHMLTRIQNKKFDDSLKQAEAVQFLNTLRSTISADFEQLKQDVSKIEERASRISQIMKNHPNPELVFMHYAQVENKRYTVKVFRKALAPLNVTDGKTQLPPDSDKQQPVMANAKPSTAPPVTSATDATKPNSSTTDASTPAPQKPAPTVPAAQKPATAPAAQKPEPAANQEKGELIATYTFEVHALSRLNVGIGIPLIKMPGHRQYGIVEQVGEGDVKEFVVRETSNDDLAFKPTLQVGVYLNGPADDLALEPEHKFMLTVGSEIDAKPKQFFMGLAWDPSSGYSIGLGITHFRQTELQEGYSVGQIIPSVLDANGVVTGALITNLPTHQSDKLGFYLGVSFRPKIFSALKDLVAKFKE